MENGHPKTTIKKIITVEDFLLMQSDGHPKLISYSQTPDGAVTVVKCDENISQETCGRCKLRLYCKSSMSKEH